MDDTDQSLTGPTDFIGIAELLTKGALNSLASSGAAKAALSQVAQQESAKFALAWKLFLDTITFVATKYEQGEQAIAPIAERAVGPILAGLFKSGAGGDFSKRMAAGGGDDAGRAIVQGFMQAIAGGAATGPIEPSTEGSTRIASAAVAASIESSINALIPELVSDFLPFDLGKISALTELPEGVLRSLGVGRLVRRALSPLVDATCATPAKWYYAKLYRQHLPDPGLAAKMYARGKWDVDLVKEYLARHGFDDATIAAYLDDTAKFLSVNQVYRLLRAGAWTDDEARQHLLDAGYFTDDVENLLLLERLTDIEAFERELATAAVEAYANHVIEEGDLGRYITGTTITQQHKAQLDELAAAKRKFRAKPLSASDAAIAVELGILAYPDYRAALVREGYEDDAVTVKELILRKKIDAATEIADHKAALAQEKADAATAKQAAADQKKADAAAKLALAARGRLSDLEQAYIRGLIPIERVEEVLRATYDADTVGIEVATLQTKRDAYVKQQAAADAAAKRAATQGINVGELSAAVLDGVIGVDQFTRTLVARGFSADDAGIIAATLQAKLDAKAAADAAHAAAAKAAKVKHIDLAGFEFLVRRGVRTLADYTALLASLGYDDVSAAALVDRLKLEIADDQAAAKTKAAAAAKLAAKGLNLDQERRAVILGLKTTGDYSAWLLAQGFGAVDVATLVGEVQADVDAATAATAKRQAADAKAAAGRAPLADVARAAKLGLIPVDVYTARLTASGYTDDDIAIELDLLTQEIAQTHAAATKAAAADAAKTDRGLTLAQLQAAVLAGEATVSDYYARALALGLSTDDADTISRVLDDRVTAQAATTSRKAQLAAENATRELARADVVKAVTDGLKTINDYGAWLVQAGYATDDAALLVAELQQTLDAKAAKAGA